MKQIFALCLGAVALLGCEKQDTIKLDCTGNDVEINISENGDKLSTVINGENINFDIAVSASGARYVAQNNGTEITLWNKGEDWTLYLDADTPITCVVK